MEETKQPAKITTLNYYLVSCLFNDDFCVVAENKEEALSVGEAVLEMKEKEPYSIQDHIMKVTCVNVYHRNQFKERE